MPLIVSVKLGRAWMYVAQLPSKNQVQKSNRKPAMPSFSSCMACRSRNVWLVSCRARLSARGMDKQAG